MTDDHAPASADEARIAWNRCRHDPGRRVGHYESYFQRANHPSRPLGWWIRYTLFSPEGRPQDAIGELWAIWFDGERGRVCAAKSAVPLSACRFDRTCLDVQVGEARLNESRLSGAIVQPPTSTAHAIAWDLEYQSDAPPLLLLPERLYDAGFPRAKALVGSPGAVFRGTITVDGEAHAIDGWVGSQNHNWGRRHTDRYAWGQVAGFDEAPDGFLECSTAQIKLGPLWSPRLTLVVLRVGGEEVAINTLGRAARADGRWSYFQWELHTRQGGAEIEAAFTAPRADFIGLAYANPPGGSKTCLNTKLADARVVLRRAGRPELRLHARRRAAFEILTDDAAHGVPVVA